ncbi:MAG: 2'-deoxycytidine 5'-triphosphate deaminase [candidate division Zixibacteria bacterium]|nr:2'-deoxycytidine 5'-triphosphate deaminase [candidate division Zixibacteria bacterium]
MDVKILKEGRPGILNKEHILSLEGEVITDLTKETIGPSAFDLHLSHQGWEMQGSIKGSDSTLIEEIGEKYGRRFSIEDKKKLEAKKTYVFKLRESLKIPPYGRLYGKATGRSSIGRLDVLTRLMVDYCSLYDEIEPKEGFYPGRLYLEVTPITFGIEVQEGASLSQLRLFRGDPELSELKASEIELFGEMILDENRQPKTTEKLYELRVDLTPDPKNNISAFRAKKDKDLVVDLTKEEKHYNPKDFWEEVSLNIDSPLKIEPERFHILRSKERFKLPRDIAVYCQAVSETIGELRIHYAGFVHPGFGSTRPKEGTPIIFEVRGHNVDTFLRDGETLAHIKFYRMSEPCTPDSLEKEKKSEYEKQELRLSSYFEDWSQ